MRSGNDYRLTEKAMHFMGILLLALTTLALAPSAHAQTVGATAPATARAENAMFDEAKLGADLPAPTVPSDPQDVTKSLQAELKRVGCFAGAIDGVWGGTTKVALADFVRRSKLDVPTDIPTSAAVQTVKSQLNRICPLDCGAGRIERNGTCVAKAAPTPARPQTAAEAKRPPAAKPEKNSGMCWRNDGRNLALVPCSEFPLGRRAY
ncbi:MAG: peptidoglycan-binding domain-containing protein [Hyphomicrobiaceae bacterium]|nr:peptidoglycan-binding domain-containing protein [Hyphomicrobiaceae bacterium]